MSDARRGRSRGLAFHCIALLLSACNSFDATLIEPHDNGGAADDPGGMDAAIGDAGDAGAGLGAAGQGGGADNGGFPLADSGFLRGCVQNIASFVCPIICPESCNNADDDCDGKIDEETSDACAVPHAESACTDGACVIVACDQGYRNCDDERENGCESGAGDINNCGECGNQCDLPNALMVCEKDRCVAVGCEASFDDCDDNESDCETAANTLKNCAACGLRCTEADVPNAAPTCEAGFCGVGKCFAGYGDCNDTPGDGCEAELNSVENCGACGKECDLRGSESDCSSGACLAGACASGYADCDGNKANGCESLAADDNCGGCGKTCDDTLSNVNSAGCGDQECVVDCAAGFDDCDSDTGTGCETPVTTRQRCGDCDTPCAINHALVTCGSGECEFVRCETGWDDCNDDLSPDDGCETRLDTLDDCGACGVKCDKASCSGGNCTAADCSAPPHNGDCGGALCGNCDGNDADCEADLEQDGQNCTTCGNQCAFNNGVSPHASLSCTQNGCRATCPSDKSFGDCNGNYRDGCEVALTTLQNCGACGAGCAISNATPTCTTGSCRVSACNANFADCNDDKISCETQLGTTSNCGGCGDVCKAPNGQPSCAAGKCTLASCNLNFLDCNGMPNDGCEVDRRSNVGNCGGCGVDCRTHDHVAGATCSNSACSYTCAQGFGDCTSATGCETPLTTATNCGDCGISCARSNGTASCSTGTCTLTGCNSGYDNCDGNAQNGCEPLNTSTDCGACGARCTVANGKGTCASRVCALDTCNSGWADCDGESEQRLRAQHQDSRKRRSGPVHAGHRLQKAHAQRPRLLRLHDRAHVRRRTRALPVTTARRPHPHRRLGRERVHPAAHLPRQRCVDRWR